MGNTAARSTAPAARSMSAPSAHRARRLVALLLALLVGLTLCWSGLLAEPASAHDGGGDETAEDSAEHAAEDLVGTSVDQVEAMTAARRAAILAADPGATGLSRAARAQGGDATTPLSTAAAANPGVVGQWGAVAATPVVPVFTAVLPDGKVLMWDSVGDDGVDTYPDQSFTRAAVLDPTTGASRRVDVQGYNIFCAGFVQLPNGDVLVAGGNKDQAQAGIRQTHVFHWRTETWTRGPDMAAERWYPSVAALGNGEALIVAGGDDTAEVYQADGTLRRLIGFASFAYREYPFLVPRADGQVEVVGPDQYIDRYDTDGTGSKMRTGIRDDIYRNTGSFATYDAGRTLVVGGGPVTHDAAGRVSQVEPTASTVLVDTTDPGQYSSFTPGASMAQPRRQQSATILADGSVLVTGGMNSTTQPLVDLSRAVRNAERWDPATGRWTTLAAASRVRQYHSSAVLLPDGRVMTGGGGICGDCVAAGYLEKNVEYFSPPYLFTANGAPATRPAITGAPLAAAYGTAIGFSSSSAASIAKVGLVRLGADTHGVDQGQKYVPLAFSRSGSTITAMAPADGDLAAPGYYMLFATTAAGVPSKGQVLRISTDGALFGPDTPGPPSTNAAPPGASGAAPAVAPRCLEISGGARRGASKVVRWTCTGGANQAWRQRRDGTLRTAGRCLTFGAGQPRVGTRVTATRCSSSRLQRMLVRRGTIRPAVDRTLCLSSARSGYRLGDRLELARCAGTARQRWTLP